MRICYRKLRNIQLRPNFRQEYSANSAEDMFMFYIAAKNIYLPITSK